MKKKYFLISLFLLLSLFIYLFYRTEKTVINEIFISLISSDSFIAIRNNIIKALPLNDFIIYSLPEGLWVFCITVTSKFLYVKIGKYKINLIYLPLIFSLGLELFQLLHITNGRFDFWDMIVSVLFWSIAAYYTTFPETRQNILRPFNFNSALCFLSYLIVYLAHVWK